MAKDGKTTFYRTEEGERYHRDRQCYFLRRARQRDEVRTFREIDPGVDNPVTLAVKGRAPRALQSCGRCGK